MLDAEFWNRRYAEGDTPWDLGQPSPVLQGLLEGLERLPGPALVLGAGRGHDARLLVEAGVPVTLVDFAPLALEAAAAGLPASSVELMAADLFDLPGIWPERRFDLLIEHTCFCAIDPSRRAEYAQVAAHLVAPGGLLVGVFYEFDRPDGPPFGSNRDEIRRLFEGAFTIHRLELSTRSIERRQGMELEAIFERRTG